MNTVILDTETSDLFDFRKPADAEGQGRLASLGAFIVSEECRIIGAECWYVKPDGWVLSEEAASVNGLTMEFLYKHGRPVQTVLDNYVKYIDSGHVVASFGAQFDCKVLRGELRRAGMDDRFKQTKNLCLMWACMDICQVPRARGKGYKWPTLEEACEFFGIWNPDQHGGIGDALAAMQIYFKLDALGLLPEPEIHYAKNRPV